MRARAFEAGLVLLAVAGTYFVLTAAKVQLPLYVPLERRWVAALPPGAIGMDWYARAGISLAAGLLALPAGRALTTRTRWAARPGAVRLVFGLGFGLLLWASLFMVFALASAPRARDPRTGEAAHEH